MVCSNLRAVLRRLGLAQPFAAFFRLALREAQSLARVPPPPPTKTFFPVKSGKQLFWLASHGRNFFFLYRKNGSRLALSLWPKPGEVLVCDELSPRQTFVSRRRFDTSFLGRAIAEQRLYVDWLL